MEGPSSTISHPSWKLYDNPSFIHDSPDHRRCHYDYRRQRLDHSNGATLDVSTDDHHHRLNMKPDVTEGRAWSRIRELRAELEMERGLRKKVESLNRALARELKEERQRSERGERQLQNLSEENSRVKADMDGLRAEVAGERKMMRMAEVLREERVQMKLLEARLVMEEKLLQFSASSYDPPPEEPIEQYEKAAATSGGELDSCDQGSNRHAPQQRRREMENPHIRRGIIGYVEFPTRLVRSRPSGMTGGPLAGTTKGGRPEMGPKLESQLRALLKPSSKRVAPVWSR